MSWDWRFGGLILLSTIIDYYIAIKIDETPEQNKRKFFLNLSLILNLICILGFFKYYNFLAGSINQLAILLGFGSGGIIPILSITLPVGISFFTFQSLSYTIDVYRRIIPVEKSFIKFALFVSFFPQLVAGPIVTAKTFIPQLLRKINFEDIDFRKAIRYFLMGYFKKVVISDNLAPIIEKIYHNPEMYGTGALWFGCFLFVIQLYGDFSGYSDMAYSTALMLGYELPENFYLPVKATSVTDFWRRWHISLSTWLRDYIYISLGGSRKGYVMHKFNLFMTMFLGGIWHGANWTFFIWGSFMGFFLAVESMINDWKEKHFPHFQFTNVFISKIFYILSLIYGVGTVAFACALFRAESLDKALTMMGRMLTLTTGDLRPYMLKNGLLGILVIVIGHYLGHLIFEKKKKFNINRNVEYSVYIVTILLIAYLTPDGEPPFVYFQF